MKILVFFVLAVTLASVEEKSGHPFDTWEAYADVFKRLQNYVKNGLLQENLPPESKESLELQKKSYFNEMHTLIGKLPLPCPVGSSMFDEDHWKMLRHIVRLKLGGNIEEIHINLVLLFYSGVAFQDKYFLKVLFEALEKGKVEKKDFSRELELLKPLRLKEHSGKSDPQFLELLSASGFSAFGMQNVPPLEEQPHSRNETLEPPLCKSNGMIAGLFRDGKEVDSLEFDKKEVTTVKEIQEMFEKTKYGKRNNIVWYRARCDRVSDYNERVASLDDSDLVDFYLEDAKEVTISVLVPSNTTVSLEVDECLPAELILDKIREEKVDVDGLALYGRKQMLPFQSMIDVYRSWHSGSNKVDKNQLELREKGLSSFEVKLGESIVPVHSKLEETVQDLSDRAVAKLGVVFPDGYEFFAEKLESGSCSDVVLEKEKTLGYYFEQNYGLYHFSLRSKQGDFDCQIAEDVTKFEHHFGGKGSCSALNFECMSRILSLPSSERLVKGIKQSGICFPSYRAPNPPNYDIFKLEDSKLLRMFGFDDLFSLIIRNHPVPNGIDISGVLRGLPYKPDLGTLERWSTHGVVDFYELGPSEYKKKLEADKKVHICRFIDMGSFVAEVESNKAKEFEDMVKWCDSISPELVLPKAESPDSKSSSPTEAGGSTGDSARDSVRTGSSPPETNIPTRDSVRIDNSTKDSATTGNSTLGTCTRAAIPEAASGGLSPFVLFFIAGTVVVLIALVVLVRAKKPRAKLLEPKIIKEFA